MSANEHFEMIANEFFLDTGYLAPGKSEAPQAYYDGRDHERQGAWNAWNRMRKNIAPPCPQCARFREKLDREKIMDIMKRMTQDGVSYVGQTDTLIKYLTE